jgi:type IV pilus assembly protein PilE
MSIKRTRGFTLMELMIVVAIVGILAAIALPAYQQQLRKSRRASAQTLLMSIAAQEQQVLLDQRAYADPGGACPNVTDAASLLSTFKVPAPDDFFGYYTLCVTVVAGPPPTFTVTATPQSLGGQNLDLGGAALTIDNTGAKSPSDGW